MTNESESAAAAAIQPGEESLIDEPAASPRPDGDVHREPSRFARLARSAAGNLDVPRLNISDSVERATFMGALFGGAAVIWVGEYFNLVGSRFALFIATLAIASYGILCFCGREQRIRLDRAGDNCYYLGLTFTLMSLSVALVKREIGESPDALIQTFGIAVGSTIVGVIARLLLIQYRMESDDIEARARVELAAAADELRGQLINAASRFQTFSVSIQESVRTAVNKVTDDQIARQKALVEDINVVLAKSIEAIGHSTTVVESSLKQHSKVMEKYLSASDRSASAADTFANKIESLAVPQDLLTRGFDGLKESLAGAIATIEEATKAFGKTSSDMSAAAVNLSQLAAQSSHVASAMTGSAASISELKGAVEGMTGAVTSEASRLAIGNKALDDEVVRLKGLSLDYAKSLSDVAQFLAKEIGRART